MLLITKPVAISSFTLSYNSIHTFSFPPDVSTQGFNHPIVSFGLLLKEQTCLSLLPAFLSLITPISINLYYRFITNLAL